MIAAGFSVENDFARTAQLANPVQPRTGLCVLASKIFSQSVLMSGHFWQIVEADQPNRKNSCTDLTEGTDFRDSFGVSSVFIRCLRVIRESIFSVSLRRFPVFKSVLTSAVSDSIQPLDPEGRAAVELFVNT